MESRLRRIVQDEKELWNVKSLNRKFIPQHRVDEILTDNAIIEVLQEYALKPWEFERAKSQILDGGKKTFAILLMLGEGKRICAFVEQEQYSNAGLDAKLPLELSAAKAYVGDRADDFELRQWELIAPVFSKDGPHLLKPGTILPFLSEQRLQDREGSFGTIYEVEMPSSHVPLIAQPAQDIIKLVRKDVGSKSQSKDKTKEDSLINGVSLSASKAGTAKEDCEELEAAFKAEMDMLKYLNDLKHPNILQLLGSYSMGTTHSFLFPQKDCNLEDVLLGRERASVLGEDECAFRALSHLASALQNLHNFTSELFEVEFIGCHRDIKPDNILVDTDGFYLADFGLSVFHSKAEGSSTSYNHGGGYYRAPECEQGATFENGRINRASDIWSFGCILAEILTYLTKDSDGVKEFKKKRTFKLYGYFETKMFHAGDRKHPEVELWLRSLPISPNCARAGLLVLVIEMLNQEPLQRPSASDVTLRLRSLSIQCQIESIAGKLRAVCGIAKDLELDMELDRLLLILKAMDRTQEDSISAELRRVLEATFSTEGGVDETLGNLKTLELEVAKFRLERTTINPRALRPLQFHLRVAVEDLLGTIRESTRKELQNRLEIKYLSTEDTAILATYSDVFNVSEEHHVLSRLAAAKLMSISLPSPTEVLATNLRHNVSALSHRKKEGHIEFADFQGEPVIVEHRRIEASWTDEYGKRLLQRVVRLAEELSKPPIPEFRTLRCVGFCDDTNALSFSLFFKFPGTGHHTSLRTMASALGHRTGKPLLEHRFHLALNLARSIAQFHKASWLHKNITSSSVVFFQPTGTCSDNSSSAQAPVDYRLPFIIGFNYSRPEDESKWSEGLISDLSLLNYHHPDYAQERRGFRIEDDYYSLGIVLLEIGLWKTLAKSIAKLEETKKMIKNASPDLLKDAILAELVPKLGVEMGSAYKHAVRFCLDGTDDESREQNAASPGTTATLMMFTEKVVKRLQMCTSALGPTAEC